MSITLYEALGNPNLKKIISDTIQASNELEIEFFGVGALARNYWYLENDLPPQGTKDVDFGVYLPDENRYIQLKSKMIQNFGYVQSQENVFCLISPDGTPVDFLPFGEIENNSKLLIESKGLTNIKLDGFKEVYQNGIRSVQIGSQTLNICTIPSVVLLKLIAFDDRPIYRSKDPLDIAYIINNYPHVEADLIWNKYHNLYEQELSHEEIGVIVIGREMYHLIKDSNKLIARVVDILQRGIDLSSSLAERMIIDNSKETLEEKQGLLKLLKRGMEEE